MKEITRDQDEIRLEIDRPVDRVLERGRHIGFALIDPGRGQTLILPEPQVQVGQMHEPHPFNLSLAATV